MASSLRSVVTRQTVRVVFLFLVGTGMAACGDETPAASSTTTPPTSGPVEAPSTTTTTEAPVDPVTPPQVDVPDLALTPILDHADVASADRQLVGFVAAWRCLEANGTFTSIEDKDVARRGLLDRFGLSEADLADFEARLAGDETLRTAIEREFQAACP